MDLNSWKDVAVSNDGAFVAAADSERRAVVVRVADGHRWELTDVSHSMGGRRLAIDNATHTLFTGSYSYTGIAAYDFTTGEKRWQRRDLGQLQYLAYDSLQGLLYCGFEGRASRPLNPLNGRERNPIRNLKKFWFSSDSTRAVFEFGNKVTIEDRLAKTIATVSTSLPKTQSVLDVAITTGVVALSYVGGPVVAFHPASGKTIWSYAPQGTHAFNIAPAVEAESVWVVEQPFTEPPLHRIRLLSNTGIILREIRCDGCELIPATDKVIRSDMSIVDIDELERG